MHMALLGIELISSSGHVVGTYMWQSQVENEQANSISYISRMLY